jgi:hypothetical protein
VRRALNAVFASPIGKDVVSRVWRTTKGDWDAWNARSLAEEPIVRLILDGTVARVRLDRKATSISLLVALGVRADGQKMLLAIKSMGGESEAAWRALLDDLIRRGLRTPELVVVDGAPGLEKALAALWPHMAVQRCTVSHTGIPGGRRNSTQISAAALDQFGYYLRRAVVVVEGATVRPFVAKTTTMIVIGLVLSVFGIGFLCWLLFTLAVYALPFFAGITMGLAAYHSGAGIIGALVVGFVAGAGTLLAGQAAFAAVKLPVLRTAIAILFAAPAAVAGFFMTLGLSRIGVPSLIWSDIFAVIGAIFVGGAAFVRIAAMATSPATGQIRVVAPAQPRITAATRGG